LFEAQPGFSVEEVTMRHRPEFKQLEHAYTFETEGEVIRHLLKEMAKWIAHYQHLDESAQKRNR
jgi:lysyl-tRNA synthetase class II